MEQQDSFTGKVAAVTLGVALLIIIGGIVYLNANGKSVEAALTGALGLLIGAFLPSPVTKANQTQVVPQGDVHISVTPSPTGEPTTISRGRAVRKG